MNFYSCRKSILWIFFLTLLTISFTPVHSQINVQEIADKSNGGTSKETDTYIEQLLKELSLTEKVTPDHLVYARAFPFSDQLTKEQVDAYRAKHGFAPKVVIHGDRIYGLGKTVKNAGLALLFAQDGAQVLKLSQAFGGVEYMTDAAREFIENWEVESYRQSVAS